MPRCRHTIATSLSSLRRQAGTPHHQVRPSWEKQEAGAHRSLLLCLACCSFNCRHTHQQPAAPWQPCKAASRSPAPAAPCCAQLAAASTDANTAVLLAVQSCLQWAVVLLHELWTTVSSVSFLFDILAALGGCRRPLLQDMKMNSRGIVDEVKKGLIE